MKTDRPIGSQDLTSYEHQSKQLFPKARAGVEFNRSDQLDDVSRRGGVGLFRSLSDLSGRENIGIADLEALLTRIAETVPDSWPYNDRSMGLVQSWKVSAQKAPVTPNADRWKSPVDASPLGSPWAEGQIDRVGQAVLIASDPKLAELYMDLAKRSPFEIVREREEREAVRKKLLSISYDTKNHGNNPWALGREDHEAQAAFVAEYGSVEAGVWREEGRQKVRLPWSSNVDSQNRTINGNLAAGFDRVPFLGCDGELFRRAAGIDSALAKALHDAAADRAARASEEAQRLALAARR